MLRRIHSPFADSKAETLLAFNSVETDLQAKYPTMLYADILAHAHAELASRLANKPSQTSVPTTAAVTEHSTSDQSQATTAGPSSTVDPVISSSKGLTEEDIAFGKSIAKWRPFPDTIAALATL